MPLCECGCGEDSGEYTSGSRKGKPKRFAYGHRCRLPRIKRTHCQRGHELTAENRDPEGRCKICKRERNTRWKRDNYDKALVANRKHHYGITEEQTKNMLIEQNYKCAICGDPIALNSAHVDHVHDETRRVRGLLCGFCNKGLGFLKDSLAVLEKAVQYLHRTEDPQGTVTEDVVLCTEHPPKVDSQ